MKEISQLELPHHVRYTEDHEWARIDNDEVICGITDYAQDQMGDIVFIELPRPGEVLKKREQFGTVESVKAVVELYMPVSGEIIETNRYLEESPQLVNTSPYSDGWMIKIKPVKTSEIDSLMSSKSYKEMLQGVD